jgi:8-oxo-dGTP pyrophosphatase MutT (NUDIX family)
MTEVHDAAVHHVVAGLLVRAGDVLLCHRSPNRRWYPDVWDLPGGHIEPGESPHAALVRELHEELEIVIPAPAVPPFARVARRDFDCRIWIVRTWRGTPHLASDEHDDLRWWPPNAIGDLPLADESYRPLLQPAASLDDG